MNTAVLAIAILASVSCTILAECPSSGSAEEYIDACVQKLLPGSSNDKELEEEIKEAIKSMGKEEKKEMEKSSSENINATTKLMTMRTLLCFADEFLKAYPEFTSVLFDCIVDAKEDSPENENNEMLESEIQNCVRSKVTEMCPSKEEKSKRSLVSFLLN